MSIHEVVFIILRLQTFLMLQSVLYIQCLITDIQIVNIYSNASFIIKITENNATEPIKMEGADRQEDTI